MSKDDFSRFFSVGNRRESDENRRAKEAHTQARRRLVPATYALSGERGEGRRQGERGDAPLEDE